MPRNPAIDMCFVFCVCGGTKRCYRHAFHVFQFWVEGTEQQPASRAFSKSPQTIEKEGKHLWSSVSCLPALCKTWTHVYNYHSSFAKEDVSNVWCFEKRENTTFFILEKSNLGMNIFHGLMYRTWLSCWPDFRLFFLSISKRIESTWN